VIYSNETLKTEKYKGYDINIKWSERNNAYCVILPDWRDDVVMPCAYGHTIEEALGNGKLIVDILIEAIDDDKEEQQVSMEYFSALCDEPGCKEEKKHICMLCNDSICSKHSHFVGKEEYNDSPDYVCDTCYQTCMLACKNKQEQQA
jgi:predicted RNase H-like HicB family nuclease